MSPGAGCGKMPPFQVETVPGTPKGYTHYTVMGTGATLAGTNPLKVGQRTFWVRVPADDDPNRPYRVVYIGQGCGGYQIANTNTYPLYNEKLGGSEQAIYVALDIPENNVNMDCYDNRDGSGSQEWEAFELFHTVVDQNYCVDNNRVFVAGYSTGAWGGEHVGMLLRGRRAKAGGGARDACASRPAITSAGRSRWRAVSPPSSRRAAVPWRPSSFTTRTTMATPSVGRMPRFSASAR